MRLSIPLALPMMFVLFCGWAASQDQQARPPAVAGGDSTDPLRMAADKFDATKPNIAGAPVDSSYEIGAEDVISIWVLQQASMVGQFVVGTDGMISVPLIGEIRVGGKTKGQVAAEVVDKLKTGEIVNDPNVTVNVVQVRSKKVYVSGDGIAKTGEMALVVPTRVSEAIAWAGGFRDFAKKSKIRIVRVPSGGGKPEVFYYNDNQVSHGKKLEQNILLKPGDHIYVDD